MYRLHVPLRYRSAAPTPVVLVFHGAGGSAKQAESSTGWSALGDRRDFAVVYPQGLPFGSGGPSAWASAGPIDFGIDDLSYVRRVLQDVQRRVCVERGAVFATGMSSGGGMAGYLACALADRIAAVAPIAGNHYTLTMLGCHPSRPVSILEVHGTADPVVPYLGISAIRDPGWPLPSIPRWMSTWGRLDRCAPRRHVASPAPDQTLIRYAQCADRTDVLLYRLTGVGHVDPTTLGHRATTAVIESFFMTHRRR